MELTKKQIKHLEEHGWEAVPPMWIGGYWDGKANVLKVVNDVMPLDTDAEGYDFVIIAKRRITE
jgi:hypothetical protein|tara:strand:- start:267 stop:458 length:192 start_codon:yes stop_codon:yes gene_type:complete